MTMMKVEGGCHCGTVRFEAYVDGPEVEVLDCDCDICRMTGYLHLIVPDDRFKLTEGQRDTTTYRFGTGRARHLLQAVRHQELLSPALASPTASASTGTAWTRGTG
jgi:hypothetical protein